MRRIICIGTRKLALSFFGVIPTLAQAPSSAAGAMSKQIVYLTVPAGQAQGTSTLLFNSETTASVGCLLPTDQAIISLVDPSGKSWPWDESREDPKEFRIPGPIQPGATTPSFWSYQVLWKAPQDGLWVVQVTFPQPMEKDWLTPISLTSASSLAPLLSLSSPETVVGNGVWATLVMQEEGVVLTDYQMESKLTLVTKPDETVLKQVAFKSVKPFPDQPPNQVAWLSANAPGIYVLEVVLKGSNARGPWERHVSSSFRAHPALVSIPGTFNSRVQ